MRQRLLLVHPGPSHSVGDVYAGWVKALSVFPQIELAVYNTDDRLAFYKNVLLPDWASDPPSVKRAMSDEQAAVAAASGLGHACYEFEPDVVFFIGAFSVPHAHLKLVARHSTVVILHTESPYDEEAQLGRAQFAHFNLINDKVNISRYRELRGEAVYVPPSYDPDVHYPSPESRNYDFDFAWVGTALDSRQAYLAAMNFDGLRVYLGGSRWNLLRPEFAHLAPHVGHYDQMSLVNQDAAAIYRKARASLNTYRAEREAEHDGEGTAISVREVELAACGVPFVREPRSESDGLFPFLPSAGSPEEASGKLSELLADEDRREQLGRQARCAVEGTYTFQHQAERVAKMVFSAAAV